MYTLQFFINCRAYILINYSDSDIVRRSFYTASNPK